MTTNAAAARLWALLSVAAIAVGCGTGARELPSGGGAPLYVPPDAAIDSGAGASSGGASSGGASSGGASSGGASSGGASSGGQDAGTTEADTAGASSGSNVDAGGTAVDAGGTSSGGNEDAGATSSGGEQDSGSTSGGSEDAGQPVEDTYTPVEDTYTPPQDAGVKDTYTPPFGGDVPLGSSEDAKPYDAGINYDDIGDTGVTGTIPGLCSPKIAQYNIEDKKTGGKVDVIWFVDTSGSMGQESKWVEANIGKFASYIAAKNIDYRIVLVGKATGCCPLNPPLGNFLQPGTFMHVKKVIYSTDGLKKMTDGGYINDFKAFLRPDASKNWVAVTDDDSLQQTSTVFHQKIMQIKHPSNPAGPDLFKDYLFHSIVAWGPLANKGCNTGARIGKQYLNLTAQTKGVKAKICDQNWDPIFKDIAQGVIKSAKPGCTYPVAFYKGETATNGFDLTYIAQDDEYKIPAAKGNQCPPNGQGFVYDKWPNPLKITICPTSCQQLKGGGNLVFNHGCL